MGDDFFNDWDAGQVEPNKGFDPIPQAEYLAIIPSAEWKKTKTGTGEYLAITFEIIEGEFKGRKLWSNLNLKNANAQAVEIAKGDFSAICRAVGKMKPRGIPDLYNIPIVLSVKLGKRKDTGELENRIGGYKPKNGALKAPTTQQTSAPVQQQPVADASAAGPAPWQ